MAKGERQKGLPFAFFLSAFAWEKPGPAVPFGAAGPVA